MNKSFNGAGSRGQQSITQSMVNKTNETNPKSSPILSIYLYKLSLRRMQLKGSVIKESCLCSILRTLRIFGRRHTLGAEWYF